MMLETGYKFRDVSCIFDYFLVEICVILWLILFGMTITFADDNAYSRASMILFTFSATSSAVSPKILVIGSFPTAPRS